MANLGVMQALLQRGELCVQDKLNHACLLDGAQLAGADAQALSTCGYRSRRTSIAQQRTKAAALLATDGVFSMDGDIAPLRELADTVPKRRRHLHGGRCAWAWACSVDEGAGSVAEAGLSEHDVPILMATLGKAVGCSGAFVAGSAALIDGLTQFARTYIYTTAMPPALAAAARRAVAIAREESWRREKLDGLIRRFRRGAMELGLPLMPSRTAIQPLLLGDSQSALDASRTLEAQGLLAIAIRPPTVPQGQARLRITLSAMHEEAHVDRLLQALSSLQLTKASV